jgi:hypothetical protein
MLRYDDKMVRHLSNILRYEDSRDRHLCNVQCSDMMISSRFLYNNDNRGRFLINMLGHSMGVGVS